jgi:hypothetical protein
MNYKLLGCREWSRLDAIQVSANPVVSEGHEGHLP